MFSFCNSKDVIFSYAVVVVVVVVVLVGVVAPTASSSSSSSSSRDDNNNDDIFHEILSCFLHSLHITNDCVTM